MRASARPIAMEAIDTSLDDERKTFSLLFGDNERPPPFKLYKGLRTLFDLWYEYEFGI